MKVKIWNKQIHNIFQLHEKSLEKVVRIHKKQQAEGICRKSREFHTELTWEKKKKTEVQEELKREKNIYCNNHSFLLI